MNHPAIHQYIDIIAFSTFPPGPFVPEEPPFPTPSSPPPPRPPDPLTAQEAPPSPNKHNMGHGPGCVSDPFSQCVAERGLLGSVLSLCENMRERAEPPSPWAGEGGYGRAPGFEREDQVRRTHLLSDVKVSNKWRFIFCFTAGGFRQSKEVLLSSNAAGNWQ